MTGFVNWGSNVVEHLDYKNYDGVVAATIVMRVTSSYFILVIFYLPSIVTSTDYKFLQATTNDW